MIKANLGLILVAFIAGCNGGNDNDLDSTIPTAITHNGVTYGTVSSPYTGKVWLDRNLGASRVCTAFNDTACYGDYYQWGRNTDGHQDSISSTTDKLATDINNAGNEFIATNAHDWTKTIDVDGRLRLANWSKVDGSSVCPIGFRVPTAEELKVELPNTSSSGSNEENSTKLVERAFTSFLKMPTAGSRSSSTGTIASLEKYGNVWTASIIGTDSYLIHWNVGNFGKFYDKRVNGYSLRCIKG